MRRGRISELVQHGRTDFTIHGGFRRSEQGRIHSVGVFRDRSGQGHARLDGRSNIPLYELAATLPIQIIEPELHKLIDEGASHRRRFMDWGVFHVEPGFFEAWRQYRRSLAQRNRSLRDNRSPREISVWSHRLSAAADRVDGYRRSYITRLLRYVTEYSQRLFRDPELVITLRYSRGWREEASLESVLNERSSRELEWGHTTAGAHRADISISFGGHRARQGASRGQQKMIFIALVLAQLAVLREATGEAGILLVDDLAAELGPEYLESVINILAAIPNQTFVTVISPNMLGDVARGCFRRFHVEQGSLEVVV